MTSQEKNNQWKLFEHVWKITFINYYYFCIKKSVSFLPNFMLHFMVSPVIFKIAVILWRNEFFFFLSSEKRTSAEDSSSMSDTCFLCSSSFFRIEWRRCTFFCSSSFFCIDWWCWSAVWCEAAVGDSVGGGGVDSLSRWVVLFLLYLAVCRVFGLPATVFLMASRKLWALETFFVSLVLCSVVGASMGDEAYLSCSFWIIIWFSRDNLPWRTASACDVTSASSRVKSRRIRLIKTKSKLSWCSSPPWADTTGESIILSQKIFALSDREKHRPKTASQSMPKKRTLGSTKTPLVMAENFASSSPFSSFWRSSVKRRHWHFGRKYLQMSRSKSLLSSISVFSWTIRRMKTLN